MENFVLYDEIGSGDKRVVYKGRRKGTIEYVAIHCVEKVKRLHLQNHVRISHELEHSNIVRFYEWYETTNHLWLVAELCTGDSLLSILTQDLFLPETTVQSFGRDIVNGLFYLHQTDILYSDLKPSKIILDREGTLKLSNFSVSHLLGEDGIVDHLTEEGEDDTLPKFLGSPEYMAPEVLQGGMHTRQSDLWSLGIVLYEMYTGTLPFKAVSFAKLVELIMNSELPYPVQGKDGTFVRASENLFMLIHGLLQKDPTQRIDWLELCMHPFWDGCLVTIADQLDNIEPGCQGRDSLTTISLKSLASAKSRQRSAQSGIRAQSDTAIEKSEIKNLETRSLDIPDQKKPDPEQLDLKTASFQSKGKLAWEGTYKLERGLAVLDLTEIPSTAVEEKPPKEEKTNKELYTKSREVRIEYHFWKIQAAIICKSYKQVQSIMI